MRIAAPAVCCAVARERCAQRDRRRGRGLRVDPLYALAGRWSVRRCAFAIVLATAERPLLRLRQATDPNPRRAYMRKPSSSSKKVIAALVAAAFGLTAGTALAQANSQSDQGNTPASHRHASK